MGEKNCQEVVVYRSAGDIRLEVLSDGDTVWLNRHQLAMLFGRDIKTIGKHIANALKEELKGLSTVAKFATVRKEGDRTVARQVEYYDLDMILSVGYRVKSPQDVCSPVSVQGLLTRQAVASTVWSRRRHL